MERKFGRSKIELALRFCNDAPQNAWDTWILNVKKDSEVTEEEYKLLDFIAELCIDPDKNLEAIITTYKVTPSLQVPERV